MPPGQIRKNFHFLCQFFNDRNEKNADGTIDSFTTTNCPHVGEVQPQASLNFVGGEAQIFKNDDVTHNY